MIEKNLIVLWTRSGLNKFMNRIHTKSRNSFVTEREGQVKFFEDFNISTSVELTHNTDGVYRGTLFEFKLTISDINKVLFQAIKYLEW